MQRLERMEYVASVWHNFNKLKLFFYGNVFSLVFMKRDLVLSKI